MIKGATPYSFDIGVTIRTCNEIQKADKTAVIYNLSCCIRENLIKVRNI